MSFSFRFAPYTLQFSFDAGTSRGVLREKKVFFVELKHSDLPLHVGLGECGPIERLSPETLPQLEQKLHELCHILKKIKDIFFFRRHDWKSQLSLHTFPSLVFALEMAYEGLFKASPYHVFSDEDIPHFKIPINGLIWMGEEDFVRKQISNKISEGYRCIKMKIGGSQTRQVLSLIEELRKRSTSDQLMLRVDANGSFTFEKAKEIGRILNHLEVHSIEQPVAPGQPEQMQVLNKSYFCPVALDEELIGCDSYEQKEYLLKKFKPSYVVLKPSLIGGFSACAEWIQLCNKYKVGWWITSMLESNLGLNAIARFTHSVKAQGYQGLGTGALYKNNINCPLVVEQNGFLAFSATKKWDNSFWQRLNWLE